MGKIRTSAQLTAKIKKDLSWRNKEIDTFKRLIENGPLREHQKSVILRGGHALLYAHWEGFIKTSASDYLEFLTCQKIPIQDLRHELMALALRSKINTLSADKAAHRRTELVTSIIDPGESIAVFSSTDVDTGSNLKFELFESIMHSIGCDIGPYVTKKNLINQRLLAQRNAIAHGEDLTLEVRDWLELSSSVEDIFKNVVCTGIENSVATRSYML